MKAGGALFVFFLFSLNLFGQDIGLKTFGDPSWTEKVLMIPGLNFKPEAFNEIRDQLLENQKEVYLLHLKFTHEENRKWEDGDLAKHWVNQAKEAFELITSNSKKADGRFIVFAYSLGGLVAENYLQGREAFPSEFKKIVYLSPAFSVKWYLKFLMNSAHVLEESIKIPSWNLEAYQTRNFTYAGEYEALLDLSENLEEKSWRPLPIETELFMSPKDELLSFEGVNDVLKKVRENISVRELKKSKKGTIGKYHLIVDSKSLREDEFHLLLNSLQNF